MSIYVWFSWYVSSLALSEEKAETAINGKICVLNIRCKNSWFPRLVFVGLLTVFSLSLFRFMDLATLLEIDQSIFFFLHNLYVLRKKLFDVFFIVILLTVRRLISCKIKTKIWRIRKRINESQPAKEKEKVPIHSKRDIKI